MLHASRPLLTVCKRAGRWQCLLRCLSWSGLRRGVLEAMSVHPILAKAVTALVHLDPLNASARAPDLLTQPAVASLIKEAGCHYHAQVHDQQELLSNEVMHNVQEALSGRSACRCGIRCQQHQWCQMLSMTWGALCACCSTGASSVLGHEVISWEGLLQTAHWERLTEEPRRVDILQACFASYTACMHLGRAYHGHCLH